MIDLEQENTKPYSKMNERKIKNLKNEFNDWKNDWQLFSIDLFTPNHQKSPWQNELNGFMDPSILLLGNQTLKVRLEKQMRSNNLSNK